MRPGSTAWSCLPTPGGREPGEHAQAFLDKRKPCFNKFRAKNKKALDTYLDDFRNDRNEAPKKKKK